MSQRRAEREVFARTMLALQPYADEIVLIGGWVHALYIAESSSGARAVCTARSWKPLRTSWKSSRGFPLGWRTFPHTWPRTCAAFLDEAG